MASEKEMDTTLRYFWGVSYGSIYPTLNKLEQDEMVSKYETKENGKNKIIYTITQSGRDNLKQWLKVPTVKDTEGAYLYYLLTAKFGVKVYEAYLEWCKEAKQILQDRSD